MKTLRQTTLETMNLGAVLDIFKNGRLPIDENELVDKIFGPSNDRGALVISGGNGIVGSGKAMQLGARLLKHNIPIVTLDLPDAPDGFSQHWAGLKGTFGASTASEIMGNIIKLNYDGSSLPSSLAQFKPRFVLEAIPEILHLKKAHYDMLRANYPNIEIRSVTSGFPFSELGVGILHPSFPHQINKIWEVIEGETSDITKLLLAIGLTPIPVSDNWSFVLDVLFCGITLAAVRYHRASNMPFWKIDKFVRKMVGPNPLRAHDAIGPGASFLTWSCLHHLAETYGEVFRPPPELVRRKNSGESWYSSNRPVVDWELDDDEDLKTWLFGPLFQMTSLMLKEQRAHLTYMNAIGELCAQFTNGIIAFARNLGADGIINRVEKYHRVHPVAGESCWYPEVFEQMDSPEWNQLYVNAEHDGDAGVITISREALNWDVVKELNRAVDWLKAEGIDKVILTGDFHLSTQLVGADTTEFYPALTEANEGFKVARAWSQMARRFNDEFEVSVGFINGKRCLGGMLELLMHCHYLISIEDARLGMPEVTLPVVPGMEGCHWPFRKAAVSDHPKLLKMLLEGGFLKAKDTAGWLIDYTGSLDECLQKVWAIASEGDHSLVRRDVEAGSVDITGDLSFVTATDNPAFEGARKAVYDCIKQSCAAGLPEALELQAKHSAAFMTTKLCNRGVIGSSYKKTMKI
ncbi:MAG: hypothetical protein H8E46_05330 [FCB group bacterium]|nr:hypothetical protein [FCB group bacterium]